MVIDSSGIFAILQDEPERSTFNGCKPVSPQGGSGGATKQTLIRQLNLERDAELLPSPLITKVKRVVGLIPNSRWECLAVQLQTPPHQSPSSWSKSGNL